MNLKLLKKVCCTKKEKLKYLLVKYLKSKGYKNIIYNSNYILAEGELPICLVAHMDTVFSFVHSEDDFIYDQKKKIMWAPRGTGFDDRVGIYLILQILNDGYRPSIVFTDLEERGGIGSLMLVNDFQKIPFLNCKCLIQLDRANEKDSVYYDCDNESFEEYINAFGFETDWGTFTDISILAPAWGLAAVNLSVGYEDEHTESERLHIDWCDETLKKVEKILANSVFMPSFNYIKAEKNFFYNKYLEVMPTKEADHHCFLCNKYIRTKYHIQQRDIIFDLCPDCYEIWTHNTDSKDGTVVTKIME